MSAPLRSRPARLALALAASLLLASVPAGTFAQDASPEPGASGVPVAAGAAASPDTASSAASPGAAAEAATASEAPEAAASYQPPHDKPGPAAERLLFNA